MTGSWDSEMELLERYEEMKGYRQEIFIDEAYKERP